MKGKETRKEKRKEKSGGKSEKSGSDYQKEKNNKGSELILTTIKGKRP